MNLVILGPQGSGKGTQSQLIAQKYHLNHISTGELLRQEAESGTPKGKLIHDIQDRGELVPFETVVEVIEPAMDKSPYGFILDGTPRDLSQAEYLDSFLAARHQQIDKAIFLSIPEAVSLDRLAKRAKLEGREDDTPQAIKERLTIYHRHTEPVISHYRQLGKLLEIDGTPDIQTIFTNIIAKLSA